MRGHRLSAVAVPAPAGAAPVVTGFGAPSLTGGPGAATLDARVLR